MLRAGSSEKFFEVELATQAGVQLPDADFDLSAQRRQLNGSCAASGNAAAFETTAWPAPRWLITP
jgi:hypothetical protein